METTWEEGLRRKKYPRLKSSVSTDVVIIGGGITGLINAYLLSKAGKKVVLLERDTLGSNATSYTTAIITRVIDTDLSKVINIFGARAAKIVWESGQKAIDTIENIIEEENIDCEFIRCSSYAFASTKKQFSSIEEEFRLYKKLGVKASLSQRNNLNFKNFGYMEIPDQAKFHPGKFIYGLAAAAEKYGAKIFEHTEVASIADKGQVAVVTKRKEKITAQDVIIATYKPLTHQKTHLKKAMYRSYVFEVDLPRKTLREAIYEDDSNPYHYFRIDSGKSKDRMIIGGEDHKDIFGDTLQKESFKGLEKFLRNMIPGVKYKIVKKWAGPIVEPTDGLALIGKIKPHYYVATGFSGNGMTYSTISGLMFRDLILGKKNPWVDVYNPKRALFRPKRLASKAKDYVEEFFGGAVKNLIS